MRWGQMHCFKPLDLVDDSFLELFITGPIELILLPRPDLSKDVGLEDDSLAELQMIVIYLAELLALADDLLHDPIFQSVIENVEHCLQLGLYFRTGPIARKLEPV
jgi:hypothetical protein